MDGEILREILLNEGATVVGFGSVAEALDADREMGHLDRAVSIGLCANLRENNLKELSRLQKRTVRILKSEGYRILSIPPDSDRVEGKFVSRLYPRLTHKVAATCAGIGWIGRNGLLVSPYFGPRLSLATVLTDAPFDVDVPITRSLCGDCTLCRVHCPSDAITGNEWSRSDPFPELVRAERCRSHKTSTRRTSEKPNCGLCITICPFGRNGKATRTHAGRGLKEGKVHGDP